MHLAAWSDALPAELSAALNSRTAVATATIICGSDMQPLTLTGGPAVTIAYLPEPDCLQLSLRGVSPVLQFPACTAQLWSSSSDSVQFCFVQIVIYALGTVHRRSNPEILGRFLPDVSFERTRKGHPLMFLSRSFKV